MRSEIDHIGIEFHLPREPVVWELLRPAAETVQAIAIADAPVHKEPRKGRTPGTYKRSIFAKRAWTEAYDKSWNVGSTDRAAPFIEWHFINSCRKAGLRTVVTER